MHIFLAQESIVVPVQSWPRTRAHPYGLGTTFCEFFKTLLLTFLTVSPSTVVSL